MFKCLWCGGSWFDKFSEFSDLFVHARGEGVCVEGCLCDVFVMCDLNEFEVVFG